MEEDIYDPEHPKFKKWLEECAKDCKCCSICWDVPCPGCMAGGICDDMCTCDEHNDEGNEEEWDEES